MRSYLSDKLACTTCLTSGHACLTSVAMIAINTCLDCVQSLLRILHVHAVSVMYKQSLQGALNTVKVHVVRNTSQLTLTACKPCHWRYVQCWHRIPIHLSNCIWLASAVCNAIDEDPRHGVHTLTLPFSSRALCIRSLCIPAHSDTALRIPSPLHPQPLHPSTLRHCPLHP